MSAAPLLPGNPRAVLEGAPTPTPMTPATPTTPTTPTTSMPSPTSPRPDARAPDFASLLKADIAKTERTGSPPDEARPGRLVERRRHAPKLSNPTVATLANAASIAPAEAPARQPLVAPALAGGRPPQASVAPSLAAPAPPPSAVADPRRPETASETSRAPALLHPPATAEFRAALVAGRAVGDEAPPAALPESPSVVETARPLPAPPASPNAAPDDSRGSGPSSPVATKSAAGLDRTEAAEAPPLGECLAPSVLAQAIGDRALTLDGTEQAAPPFPPGAAPPKAATASEPHASDSARGPRKRAVDRGPEDAGAPTPKRVGESLTGSTDVSPQPLATPTTDIGGGVKSMTLVITSTPVAERALPEPGARLREAFVSVANHAVIRRDASGAIDVPELGRIAVRAHSATGGVDVDVRADRADTRAVLHAHASALANDLHQAELPLARLTIERADAEHRPAGPPAADSAFDSSASFGDRKGSSREGSPRPDGSSGGADASTENEAPAQRRVRIVL